MYFCSTLFFAMFSQPQHYLERLGLPANIFSSVVILTLVRAVCWCIDCHYLFFFVAFILHFLPSSFVKLFLVMSFGRCFIFTTNSSRSFCWLSYFFLLFSRLHFPLCSVSRFMFNLLDNSFPYYILRCVCFFFL